MTALGAQRVLLVGGTSEIGLAIVRRLAADAPVGPVLIGRDRGRLESAAASLESAGITAAEIALADADDVAAHAGAPDRVRLSRRGSTL